MRPVRPENQYEVVDRIAEAARERGLRIAAAESLTSGRVMSRLGAGSGASEWFAGGVVAYDEEVKFDLLKVDRGPVITARCARQLATGVADLLGADVAVGITGCGGPDPEEDQPPGTIYVAVSSKDGIREEHHVLDGGDDPDQVLDDATGVALALLAEAVGDL
jgi:nicotinamide-nucleotide amidase